METLDVPAFIKSLGTDSQVAKVLHLHPSSVWRLRTGKSQPSWATASKLMGLAASAQGRKGRK